MEKRKDMFVFVPDTFDKDMFVFVPDTFKQICVSFLHLLVKYSALQLFRYLFSSLIENFPEYWAKEIFYRPSNI